jgi:maltooligosyltrehalose trehalohydrolase
VVAVRVWAPLARTLDLVTAAGPVPLVQHGEHWTGKLPAGTDYMLRLDGTRLLPDPRSRWQQLGAGGPSRAFARGGYRWRDADWAGVRLPGGTVYELHVGTFTREGTLDAAAGRLDHLARLGLDAVQLMPLGAAPGPPGWGYDSALPDTVRAEYGGPRALQRFVDACHRRGLAVLLDVVYNHLGPRGAPRKHLAPWFSSAGRTPWGKAMNLAAPEVRHWIVDGAVGWLHDFHLDGLRLDAVLHLDGGPRPVVAEMAERVAGLAGVPRWLVGEVRPPRPVAAGGLGLAAQWDWGPGAAAGRLVDEALPICWAAHSSDAGRSSRCPVRGSPTGRLVGVR